MHKNERYIVEIKEKDGRWEPVRDFKKSKIGRIDNLKSNTVYSVRMMAENEYLSKSKYSKVLKIKTMMIPKCIKVQMIPLQNLCFVQLERESIREIMARNGVNASIQILMNDETEWIQIVDSIKKDQLIYECQIDDVDSITFYNVRFEVDCNGYSEYSKVSEFSRKEVEPTQIELEYYSHRGHVHGDSGHPKNLLHDDKSKGYMSKYNQDFQKNESDWIIFKIKNQSIIPTEFGIKQIEVNHYSIKNMKIFIGNEQQSKWYGLQTNGKEIIQCQDQKQLQWFHVLGVDHGIIRRESLRNIKIELLPNNNPHPAACRFIINQFKFKGVAM